jgi:hypothetical protein
VARCVVQLKICSKENAEKILPPKIKYSTAAIVMSHNNVDHLGSERDNHHASKGSDIATYLVLE